MSALSTFGGLVGARIGRRGHFAFGVTAVFAGVRVFRRLTRVSDKPAVRFAVKPGEVYEIRGTRRGR